MSTKARLVIDAREAGRPGGFGTHLALLLRGLRELRDERGTLAYEPHLLVRPGFHVEGFAQTTIQASFLSPREWIEIPRVLRKVAARLYHSPTFSALPVRLMPCPWMITVHDLNHLQFGGIAQRLYYSRMLRPFAAAAAATATVSRFSAEELATWLGRRPGNFPIVGNAVDPELLRSVGPIIEIPAPLAPGEYFLSLTNPKPHKNTALLFEAYARYRRLRLSQGRKALSLAITVSPPGPELSEGIVALSPVAAPVARNLVRGAAAVLFPSLYEGFGLPPLEAAAVGVPVLLSDIPPHREIFEGVRTPSGQFLSPVDPGVWSAAMAGDRVGWSAKDRAALCERFSLRNFALRHDELYQRSLFG